MPVSALDGDDRSVRRWARENPVEAEALSRSGFEEMRAAEPSARDFAQALLQLDAASDPSAVERVSEAWGSAPPNQRATWAVRFPAAIGGLNGVPFFERSRANALLVVGLLVRTERALEGVPGPPVPREGQRKRALYPLELWLWEHRLTREQRAGMRLLKGLRDAAAWDGHELHVLWVSSRGDGEFVVTRGSLSPSSRSIAVFVAGTLTFGGHLSMNLSRLSGIDGRDEEPESAVGIYWQGAEFPRLVTDNREPRFNRSVRSTLAAFDKALDLEALRQGASLATKTYVGHSYGGSAIGSAEASGVGLRLDRLVYAGSPGAGMGVESPADTDNPSAERYFLVSPSDWKPRLGRWVYGRVMGAHPVSGMGARPLETGFLDHRLRARRLQNHNDYLTGGSTSALNIKAVVLGRPVLGLGGVPASSTAPGASAPGWAARRRIEPSAANGPTEHAARALSALRAFVGALGRLGPGSTRRLRRRLNATPWPDNVT